MITAFWEVPGFWALLAVMLILAAVMALAITLGPGEDAQPEPCPSISTIDADTIHAWDLTKAEWDSITPEGRAFYRNNITKAPRFAETFE